MKRFALRFSAFGLFAAALLHAQVSATVSSQGSQPISQTSGTSPKNAVLVRVDVCNDSDSDVNVASSRISASLINAEQFPIYGSEVVDAVLAALQRRDIFTRAQKALVAGTNAATVITALFKTLSPTTIAVIQAAPAIASAILPGLGDPRDLNALSRQIMQDNSAFVLGKKGSGNDCHTSLIVAATGNVKIDRIAIQ